MNHHKTIFAGILVEISPESECHVAIALRDETYLLDFIESTFTAPTSHSCTQIIAALRRYSDLHSEKILGVAISRFLHDRMPGLCPQLWTELDIVPIILDEESDFNAIPETLTRIHFERKPIDEQAESLSRKCIRFFGPSNLPLVHVGFRGRVEVDSGYHIQLADRDSFRRTVRPDTWTAVEHYASDLNRRGVKISFFSATPQGGGVALMRHAAVRLAHEVDVDIKWYVPKPRPDVFRITKTNHNILQGVSAPDERLTGDRQQQLADWIQDNAERYWLQRGGPLSRSSEGGADVIIIDDAQMRGLIPIAKSIQPHRPIIYRSHIQLRRDLISPQCEIWKYRWEHIRRADIFISHPVADFVPKNVPFYRVGYMPACTDWYSGLNDSILTLVPY
ncbi:uncharacterized protein N7477_004295 [Penicillium maclennaniae]|uniref:uncharacterized protein n=1 Tax=Penicillium maclennaniae TaxID=1343394 RepID=UPI00253F7B0C|nr:uncharacterized protein N7477_004295 [Penicillium maclennaniae]KAJ5674361.1 hypothetical protein N7477_004295 [Penicillium maclennaniae]